MGVIPNPLGYFSVESMGLDEFSGGEHVLPEGEKRGWTSSIASGVFSIGKSTASYLLSSATGGKGKAKANVPPQVLSLHERLDPQTERTFLCFSWWVLHVGWRELEEEVEGVVREVCKRYVFLHVCPS